MSAQLKLTPEDEWFLEKAYLLKPQAAFNLSSIAVFDDNVEAHEAFNDGGFQRLTALGYIIGLEDRTWEVLGRAVDVVIFQLTPLGLTQAEKLIAGRRRYSVKDKILAISRSDWIALLALVVSVVALFQAAK